MAGSNDYSDDSDCASGYIFILVSSPPPRQLCHHTHQKCPTSVGFRLDTGKKSPQRFVLTNEMVVLTYRAFAVLRACCCSSRMQ